MLSDFHLTIGSRPLPPSFFAHIPTVAVAQCNVVVHLLLKFWILLNQLYPRTIRHVLSFTLCVCVCVLQCNHQECREEEKDLSRKKLILVYQEDCTSDCLPSARHEIYLTVQISLLVYSSSEPGSTAT